MCKEEEEEARHFPGKGGGEAAEREVGREREKERHSRRYLVGKEEEEIARHLPGEGGGETAEESRHAVRAQDVLGQLVGTQDWRALTL